MVSAMSDNMEEIKNIVKLFIREQETCLQKLAAQSDTIKNIVEVLTKTRDQNGKVYTMGNGGSASTASHFVSDLLKTSITEGNKRFYAISLVDNIPVTLAWANDVSYDDIFLEQLKNFLNRGDVVIGFSGSGKSKNVAKAMNYAKDHGAYCIGITGMSGGDLKKICDICLTVPSNDMLAIESIHVMICHAIISTMRKMGKPVFRYE